MNCKFGIKMKLVKNIKLLMMHFHQISDLERIYYGYNMTIKSWLKNGKQNQKMLLDK